AKRRAPDRSGDLSQRRSQHGVAGSLARRSAARGWPSARLFPPDRRLDQFARPELRAKRGRRSASRRRSARSASALALPLLLPARDLGRERVELVFPEAAEL